MRNFDQMRLLAKLIPVEASPVVPALGSPEFPAPSAAPRRNAFYLCVPFWATIQRAAPLPVHSMPTTGHIVRSATAFRSKVTAQVAWGYCIILCPQSQSHIAELGNSNQALPICCSERVLPLRRFNESSAIAVLGHSVLDVSDFYTSVCPFSRSRVQRGQQFILLALPKLG